jgi:hypothetical protein
VVVKDWSNAGASASTLSVEPLRPSAKKDVGDNYLFWEEAICKRTLQGFFTLSFSSNFKFFTDLLKGLFHEIKLAFRENLDRNSWKYQLLTDTRDDLWKYFIIVISCWRDLHTTVVCGGISPKLFFQVTLNSNWCWDISPKLFFPGQCKFPLMLSYHSKAVFSESLWIQINFELSPKPFSPSHLNSNDFWDLSEAVFSRSLCIERGIATRNSRVKSIASL